jgi:hypothetical protein
MSLALIEESAKEVRRLAIAGSPLAAGDFRLKKLIAPLEQAGAKVPVFAQVAKAVSEVVQGTEAESATRLLSLSTLLNAILYTQGQTTAAGDFRELETFETKCASTRTTARALKPIIQALSTSGGGRIEVIKSAVERGAFNDLRLIDPSIQALGDNYPEIADLVAEKILPGFGPGIIPRLKATFDPKGKRADARKLAVMHQLDPAGMLELCKTALDDGSPEVKAVAIACLGEHEDCLTLVMEQSKSKNKQLRAAALEALARHERPEVTQLFLELVKGKALDILAGPFRTLRNRQVLNSLLEEGRRVFGLLLNGDSEQIPRWSEIMGCLAQRKDPEVEAFLLGCFAQSDALQKVKAAKNSTTTGTDLVVHLAALVYQLESPSAYEAIVARRDTLPPAAFPQLWHSALRRWTPEQMFQEFSPLLKSRKGADAEKRRDIERFIHAAHARQADAPNASDGFVWDPRWLDAAIAADAQPIVYWMARPNHQASVDYLLNQTGSKQSFDVSLTVRALARCQYPKVTEYFLDQVARKTKGARYLDYELQMLLASARHLPLADLPQLDAFAAKLDEKFVDPFLEAIASLRSVTPPN